MTLKRIYVTLILNFHSGFRKKLSGLVPMFKFTYNVLTSFFDVKEKIRQPPSPETHASVGTHVYKLQKNMYVHTCILLLDFLNLRSVKVKDDSSNSSRESRCE